MSRPRRAAASSSRSNAIVEDTNIDPEFLALSAKQKRNIDRAFNRGVQILEGGSKKKRKIEKKSDKKDVNEGGFVNDDQGEGGFMPEDDGGGGFMDDGDEGGFMLDDNGGGGFMSDDDGAGGFFPDDQEESVDQSKSRSISIPPDNKRIPLHLLPPLLASLGLPSDEDVLSVFKASASGWEEEDTTSYRKRGSKEDEENNVVGVELKDFRAVCAALMEPDEGGDDLDEDEEDTFELPSEDDESELSSLSGSEYGNEGSPRVKNKNIPKVKSKDYANAETDIPKRKLVTRGKKNLNIDSNGKPKLNSRQKELSKYIWEMLKPSNKTQQSKNRDSNVLGRDEVKKWVRELGEMWNDEEITEMVTLFSSQHEGRGLTFDDFSAVMLRAGLV